MNHSADSEDDTDYLHFPVDAVRERLQQANASNDVGPTAAVYCSAILQFLTSKVLNEAVKAIENENNDCENQTKSDSTTKKRKRSANVLEYDSDEIKPPHKKRRICPKDITRALQTDPSLKEWADLIQIPSSQHNTEQTTTTIATQHINHKSNTNINTKNNCLEGFVISFEGNFEISQDIYCQRLKKSLECEYKTKQNTTHICKRVLYTDLCETEAGHKGMEGHILSSNVSSLMKQQFVANPSSYCLTFLYHSSTILSQQLQCACSHSFGKDRFFILNQSPVGLLAQAMLFMHKQYLSKKDFRLYLNSHQNELFPPCFRPDLTIFVQSNDKMKRSIFDANDRCLMDDFLFELLIRRIASRKYGKYVFFAQNEVSTVVMDVLLNKKEVCSIYWESDLKAFNNVQNPNVVNPNRRIVYCREEQIADGLRMIQKGDQQICDVVYIHISLWMKPQFKRLVMAHLCRFESICFYALRHRDLDDRAKQIVHWIFAK